MSKKNKKRKNNSKKKAATKQTKTTATDATTDENLNPHIRVMAIQGQSGFFGPSRKFKSKHSEGFIESGLSGMFNEDGPDYVKIEFQILNTSLPAHKIMQHLEGYSIFEISSITQDKANEKLVSVSTWSLLKDKNAIIDIFEMTFVL